MRVPLSPAPKVTKSERTRAAILDAALEFLWTRPFREMTVNALMAETQLSRSAFYQYFQDVHELMESLLGALKDDILTAARPWFLGVGDPVALLTSSLGGLVRIGYDKGPFVRAVADAATTDTRMERAWNMFLGEFDDAVADRIQADQAQDLIAPFDPRPVAISLNRLDAYTFVDAFGQRPRRQPEPVRLAVTRIWISTLYGSEWSENESSDLERKAPSELRGRS